MSKLTPRTSKPTWWNEQRIRLGFTHKEVAEAVGISSESHIGMIFSGQIMPSAKTIEAICELFKVDLTFGTHKFKEAHDAWDAEPRGKMVLRGEERPTPPTDFKKNKPKAVTSDPEEVLTKDKAKDKVMYDFLAEETKKEFLKQIYSFVSFEGYEKIREIFDGADLSKDICESIYGKVSMQDFEAVREHAKAVLIFKQEV